MKGWQFRPTFYFIYQGDVAETLGLFEQHQHMVKVQSGWWQELTDKITINKTATQELALDISVPLNYYAVFDTLQNMMPKDAIIVSEGANTMDIGRTMLMNSLPKHR